MAGKTVNPTRMELTRLKGRLKTASRGHKLLKDKRDEQMRQFMILVRRSRQLRAQVEQALAEAQGAFTVAAAVMSPEMLQQALMCPKQRLELETGTRNIMGVETPDYHLQWQNDDPADLLPYGFAQTSGELDTAIETMGGVLPQMLELAETEKAVLLLAEDIEKTRRRVNALEYVMIPDLERNIKYISMKLEENERANTTRLMKVKDMVLQDAHHYKS